MTCNLWIIFKRIRVTTAITLAMLLAVGLSFASLPVQAGFAPDLQDEYWNGDIQPKNKLDDLIDVMADDDIVDIIVLYDPTVMREGCDLSEEAEYLSDYGEVEYVGKYIHAITVSNVLVKDVKSAIIQSPNIFRIEKQPIYRASLDVSARAVKARESDEYDYTAHNFGYRGSGINIAILDTGVDDEHESLAGKFVAGYNALTDTEKNPDDDNMIIGTPFFHGTHCACIAMGKWIPPQLYQPYPVTYMGIAPEAKLIDIKVLDSWGYGNFTSIARGIEWAIDNRTTDWEDQPPEYDGIDVLSLSFGYEEPSNGNDALSILVNEAVNAGLVVVTAAGNSGEVGWIGAPASADRAITVGAVDDQTTVDRSDDVWAWQYFSPWLWWGSQTGPRDDDGDLDHFDEMKPDVVAPGVNIMSALGTDPGQLGVGYHELSGTSMACPHVAGIAALILERGEKFGGYTPEAVKTILRNTAEDTGTRYNPRWDLTWDQYYGKGIVDAYKCISGIIQTDLGFLPDSCTECGHTGRSVCYPGTSVISYDEDPVAGRPNKLHAVVTNYGYYDVAEATVIFSCATTGIGGWVFHEIGRTTIGPIGRLGLNDTATIDWIPQPLIITPTWYWLDPVEFVPVCIRAEVVSLVDYNLENNIGQISVDVRLTSSPADLNFMIVNPFSVAKDIDLIVDKTDLPSGWTTVLSSDRGIFDDTDEVASLSMGEACPEFVTLTITPPEDAGPGERGSVTVRMYIEGDYIGEQTLVAIVPQPTYLTVDSTAGGSVITPGEGTFTYDRGTVVSLVAQAEEGYHFVNCTGDVGTIANVNCASTTITMEGNYQITAEFWEGDPCFIATAAYGTPMAEEIQILREFRDEYLLTNPAGQALVGLYYRASPPIAEFITEHPSLKPIVRAGLVPAVAMSAVAVNTTPAEKTAIIGLLVLVSVALAIWARRRRGRGPQYSCG